MDVLERGRAFVGVGGDWGILSAGTNEYGGAFLSPYRSILRNSEIERQRLASCVKLNCSAVDFSSFIRFRRTGKRVDFTRFLGL